MVARKRTVRNVAFWTVAVAFALIGVIVFASAWGQTPKGETLVENPGALIGAVVTGLGGLMTAILPAVLRIEKNSEELKEQVKNDHKKQDGSPLLLRDDLDDKHEVLLQKLGELHHNMEARFRLMSDNVENIEGGLKLSIEMSQANASDVRGMRRDLGRLTDDIRENTRETARVARETENIGKLASSVIKTVSNLEGEITNVKTTIEKYHPEEKP